MEISEGEKHYFLGLTFGIPLRTFASGLINPFPSMGPTVLAIFCLLLR